MTQRLRLNARLRAIRDQLGATGWADRVAAARRKQSVARRYDALVRGGATRAQAARALETSVPLGTLDRWRAAFLQHGLPGLIDAKGRLRTKGHLDPVAQPRRRSFRTRPALSFIRWVGSKQSVLAELLARVPPSFGRYFEPFVGSGALFLALRPERAVLGDLNGELVEAWRLVRDEPDALIRALARHRNTSEHYHRVRAQDPRRLAPLARAARLIYLNKTCFNGLYRLNASGRFNVPYGRIAHARVVDEPVIRRTSAALARATLTWGDFEQVCAGARRGDLVYLDPPYLMTPQRQIRYQQRGFGEEEHRRLAALAHGLAGRGCHVMVSNADLPLVRRLYRGFTVERLSVRRAVNANAEGRGGFTELLIHNLAGRGRGKAVAEEAVRRARSLEG